MNEWTVAGLIVGFIVGTIFGGAIIFAYITYRSYMEYVKYQQILADSAVTTQQIINNNGGMSA
jgi:hypothetical protein